MRDTLKISAIKSSRTIKVDYTSALYIASALYTAAEADLKMGWTETAEEMRDIASAMYKAICVIDPNDN